MKSLKITDVQQSHTEIAKRIAVKHLDMLTVDKRSSFRRGTNHPHLIYLSTVLSWVIKGKYSANELDDFRKQIWGDGSAPGHISESDQLNQPANCLLEQIVRDNSSALVLAGKFLADLIDSGTVAVYNKAEQLVSRIDKGRLVSVLSTMKVENIFSGLAGLNDLDYSLDGKMLYKLVTMDDAITNNFFQLERIKQHLLRDAPIEWRTHPAQAEITTVPASVEQSIPAAMVEAKLDTRSSNGDWKDQARIIADECFDKDTKSSCRDSLKGYSKRVMKLMQERGIKGPRGIIDNENTVKREALQGKKWWSNKTK